MSDKPLDVEALIAGASLPEKAVTLVLKGALVGEFEALQQRLEQLYEEQPTSIGERSEKSEIVERMAVLRKEMLQHCVTFRVRAIPSVEFADLRAQMPGEKDTEGMTEQQKAATIFDYSCVVIARILIEPVMKVDEVRRLCERLSLSQQNRLFDAAWTVNTGVVDVPKSWLASAIMQGSDGT